MFSIRIFINYSSAIAISSAVLLSACHALPETDSEKSYQHDSIAQDKNIKHNSPKESSLSTTHNKGFPSAEAIKACKAKGGKLLKQGRMQHFGCVITYADAGKQCQDDSDCEGACYSNSRIQPGIENQYGQCSKTSSVFGCRQKIVNGVAQPTLCVD